MALHVRLAAQVDRQAGVVTSPQVRELGGVDGQMSQLIRAGLWVRERRGVYSLRAYRTASPHLHHLIKCAAMLAGLDGDNVISHLSALPLRGLPLPPDTGDLVHVTRQARSAPGQS